jgi:hypothetical protein
MSTCVTFASSIEPFPTVGNAYTSIASGNGTIPAGGQTGYMWQTGDSVTSSVFTLPTSSVTGLTENWAFLNSLLGGGTETWNVYLNAIQVGSEVLTASSSSLTNTLNFAGVAPVGGGYQIELILQNTVPDGLGSMRWNDGGTTTLLYGSATPEPGTMALFALGLIGLGFLRRKVAP